MVIPLAGIIGGLGASRLAYAGFGARLFKSPIIQGGSFGVGYTGGSYLGYGASNTWDPFSLHNKNSYRRPQQLNLGMSYGSYGRRRYGRSYGNRYSGYTRYSRRSYYRRRRPYYRRRSYY
ncbi:MAG TPA: hypothetical protein EYN67_08600 [Flavobacteriales bacterium]|nr:hypothetical protein [Flavobacteriales bacterium]